MPSTITWLDYSSKDQEDVRALIRGLEERGTLDDLGIGTIRDAISNGLFPGTSTIQTRARYFLFIPWIFRRAEEDYPGKLVEKAGDMERSLIGAFDHADDREGLIGRDAGVHIRTLPSSIYWSGLRNYGIFVESGLTIRQYGRRFTSSRRSSTFEDELADRGRSFWNRDIPAPPPDFFSFESAGFSLTEHEAIWLLERIGSTTSFSGGSSLLSRLLADRVRSATPIDADRVWEVEIPQGTPSNLNELVEHARCFAFAVQGGQLLYNLMLAERRERDFGKELETSIEERRDELAQWRDRAAGDGLGEWARDVEPFREGLIGVAGSAPKAFDVFLRPWCRILAEDLAIWDNSHARNCLESRERRIKGSQSRFVNARRLRDWDGYVAQSTLDFRWAQVRSMINEIGDAIAKKGETVAGA